MISFAGYPLVVEDRIVGVMGMFSQKPLTESILNYWSSLMALHKASGASTLKIGCSCCSMSPIRLSQICSSTTSCGQSRQASDASCIAIW